MSTPDRKPAFIVYFIGITAALAGLLFGLDVGVISGAAGFIEKEFNITPERIGYVVSALLWGAVFGTLISGLLSNKLGRRKTLLIASVIFVAGSLFCAFSTTEWLLIGSRFILGTAVGLASFTAPLYLSEIAPQRVRGALIAMYQLMITIGIVIAFLSDTWLSTYATFGGVTGGHWRMMLGIIALPAVLMFFGVLFLPESPRWLFLKGMKGAGVGVFKRMKLAEAEIAHEVQEIEDSLRVKQDGWHLLLTNRNFARAISLGVGLQIIQQFTGINVLMYYAPTILNLAGFQGTEKEMWGTVLIGVTNVLSTFIAIAFVDRIGRKPIMYAGFVVMGLSLLTVGMLFKMGVEHNPSLGYFAVAALLTFIIGFAMSAGPIIWILCAEIFPLAGRDLGVTFSTATNWIANGLVGMFFLVVLHKFGGGNTFLALGALNVLFIIFFVLYVPETKGVTLEKIEANLLSGQPLRKIGR